MNPDPPTRHLVIPVLFAMFALGFLIYGERMAGLVTGCLALSLWVSIGVGQLIKLSKQ